MEGNIDGAHAAPTGSTTLPRRLHPGPGKPLVFLTGAGIMAALGLWLLRQTDPGVEGYLIGIGMIVIALLLGLTSVVFLLPGAMYLEVDRRGLTIKTLFRYYSYPWRDLQGFGVFGKRGSKMVGLRFVDGSKHRSEMLRRMSAYGKEQTGFDGALPPMNFGMPAQELADFLNSLRNRFTH